MDTSAILSLVDRDDQAHGAVRGAFALGRDEPLVTHAYVVIETLAVARRRFGPIVTAAIVDGVLPALEVASVDAELQALALRDFRAGIQSSISLVDRVSFAFMRREGLSRAIALDSDFRTAGFGTLP